MKKTDESIDLKDRQITRYYPSWKSRDKIDCLGLVGGRGAGRGVAKSLRKMCNHSKKLTFVSLKSQKRRNS